MYLVWFYPYLLSCFTIVKNSCRFNAIDGIDRDSAESAAAVVDHETCPFTYGSQKLLRFMRCGHFCHTLQLSICCSSDYAIYSLSSPLVVVTAFLSAVPRRCHFRFSPIFGICYQYHH